MARLPGYIKNHGCTYEGGKAVLTVSLRKWHPGFYWLLLKTIWQSHPVLTITVFGRSFTIGRKKTA